MFVDSRDVTLSVVKNDDDYYSWIHLEPIVIFSLKLDLDEF